MRRFIGLLILAVLPVMAIGASELFDQVNSELEKGPWQARLVGKIVGPGGEEQEADLIIKALPAEKVVRIEFQKPDALADNYVVITPEKVYNYLFLTNQVIVYPREKARIEGLGFDLSRMGDLRELGEKGEVSWSKPKETTFKGRSAWYVTGNAADPATAGYARIEVWVAKKPVEILRTVFYSSSQIILSDLEWVSFEHVNFPKNELVSFPPDAEWIEKK